jgi:hypothetical protein
MIIDSVLSALSHSIENQDNAMQVYLLNLTKVIFF